MRITKKISIVSTLQTHQSPARQSMVNDSPQLTSCFSKFQSRLDGLYLCAYAVQGYGLTRSTWVTSYIAHKMFLKPWNVKDAQTPDAMLPTRPQHTLQVTTSTMERQQAQWNALT